MNADREKQKLWELCRYFHVVCSVLCHIVILPQKGENREDGKSLVVHTRLSGDTKVVLDIQQYADNDNLYIGLICDEEDREPFCNLTVNLGGGLVFLLYPFIGLTGRRM